MIMTPASSPNGENKERLMDTIIRIGVLALLLIWCFLILQPFILPVLWGIIIAVAIHPLYNRLVNFLQGRRRLAATLVTLILLVLLMVPTLMLTKLLVQNVAVLANEVRNEHISIPLLPDSVKNYPIIGEPLAKIWQLAATNFTEVLKLLQPQLKVFGTWLIKVAASAGIGMLIVLISVVIAGVLLANSAGSSRIVQSIAARLAGLRGAEFAYLAEATIRNVARGVLGIAVIQALLAGIGFMAAGIPGAGIWALLCLISATMQLGVGPIVIPVIIYVFATGDTLTAILFLIWNVIVMVLDNILKPLLLGRGVGVPMLVIFLGAVGGMLMSGIVGLFTGAIVLAIGYKLLQVWLDPESQQSTTTGQR